MECFSRKVVSGDRGSTGFGGGGPTGIRPMASHRYNGLGYRTGIHYDATGNGVTDGSDPWYYFAYDKDWRIVATFRGTDAEPKEQFFYHHAGINGSASPVDSVIMRDRDANTAWTAATDEVQEERRYYCQNWRGDVVAVLGSDAYQIEQVRYSAYGTPTCIPAGDTNASGLVHSSDADIVQYWITNAIYDVRGDLDLDGDVDITDKNAVTARTWNASTAQGGRGNLSTSAVANRKGYAGYERDAILDSFWHVRHRVYSDLYGRWLQRDPIGYVDGMSLYEYVSSQPIIAVDPTGKWLHVVGGCALGAIFGGGWEYTSCVMRGESNCRCKAGCAAGAGCIEGACTAAFPGFWSRCLCGAIAAALEAACQATLCSDEEGIGNSWLCIAAEIVVRAIGSCLGGIDDLEKHDKLLLWVFGMNLSSLSDICDNLRDFARSDIANVNVVSTGIITQATSISQKISPTCKSH